MEKEYDYVGAGDLNGACSFNSSEIGIQQSRMNDE